MTTPTTIADERLVQIVDHKIIAQDWEISIIASELLARRARERQQQREIGMSNTERFARDRQR